MAFGKRENYTDSCLSYAENIDMLLFDLKSMGYKNLTKEVLLEVLYDNFSIGRAVRMEVCKILDHRDKER